MNFNQAPYFDDFDEQKKFYRVLFRPGVAVQTREVNQLQSILQNQITKFGDHVFKNGSMVIPGQVNYNDKLQYLKITSTNLGSETLDWLVDKTLTENSNGTGVRALVIAALAATNTDPTTLVLLYTQSNQDVAGVSDLQVFDASSTVYVLENPLKTLTVSTGNDINGRSVAAAVQAGVYYYNGYFVSVDSQVAVVKKYADELTDINARLGLQFTESIITADDDVSLYDNAAGTPNAAAPGAHRYSIDANFIQIGLNDTPENFFELMRVQDGVLQNLVNASQYNILEETLARRTFDESGNYVVDNFKFELREARNNNRGAWSATNAYQVGDYVQGTAGRYFECLQSGTSTSNEPTQFSDTTADETVVITDGTVRWRYTTNVLSNRGLSQAGDSSNLVAVYGLGKAYVQGYEVDKLTNSNITIPKARNTRSLNNTTIYTPVGNYVWLDKRYMSGVIDVSSGPTVNLFDRTSAARSGNRFGFGQHVGTARTNWVESDGRGGVRVGLSDIQMKAGKSLDRDANSLVVYDSVTGTTVTSFTLTGNVKYAGGSTSSYLQISGLMFSTSQGATTMAVTGQLTAYLSEISVGDSVTFGNSSHATTCSWTVVSVGGNTSLTLTGPPITLAAAATTSIFIRAATQVVLGAGTGLATRFQSEYRVGDTMFIGSTNTSLGTVVSIISETRMLVSSVLGRQIANTSHGAYYSGRNASFVGDVWENYQLGINARKLTGLFQIQDYTGGTTLVQAHGAIRIQGTNDARLLSETVINDFVDINNNRIFITKISSNSVAYGVCLDSAVSGSTTQYPAFSVSNSVVDSRYNTLLFPVASSPVSSIVDNIYTVYKTQQVAVTIGTSGVTVTLAAASGNAAAEQLASSDPNAFFVAQDSVSTLSGPITVNSVNVAGLNVTLSVNSTFSSASVRVIYPVVRAAASGTVLGRVRSKTLTLGVSDEFLTTSVVAQRELVLSRTDIYRVAKILQATSIVAAWTTSVQTTARDITNQYTLDPGQRDTYYDLGRLTLRPGISTPQGSIKVFYDYFEHGAGDFFARNSYNPVNVPAELIPVYNGVVNLGNVLDFRTSVNSSTGLLQTAAPPRFGTNFVADISFYLGRKEKIFLDRTGEFYSVAGASDLNPVEPLATANNNSIHLNTITLKPYTNSAEYPDVAVKSIDNRRYTMRDIGGIERRVVNLEEATALSLLETKTSALQIRDNLDSTLERYKTGFFVDNFSDASNADHTNDGRFSLDDRTRTILPYVEYFSLPLVEKINYLDAVTTASEFNPVRLARLNENYAITGDLLTLNYTTSVLLEQSLATTSISVAPFLTATFLGRMKIVPDQDIYENITTVNQVIGSETNNTIAEAVAAYRATGNWRPYRIAVVEGQRLVGTDRTAELIPFCRANTILMVAKGLKANGRHYVFFDDINAANYVTGAMKFTFDSMPILDFDGVRAAVKNEVPRRRSAYQTLDVQEVVRAILVRRRRRRRRWAWRYEFGWFRRTWSPASRETTLPSAATRDSYKQALGAGPSVWYYEGRSLVGTAVAAHQDGTTLYLVNCRGKLSPSFLRAQASQSYTYGGTFYVSVDSVDPKYVPSNPVTVASACTSNTAGELFSDAQGTVVALFDLPDTDDVKFLSGRRPVVITDHPSNDPDLWTSRSEATYFCEGFDVTITKNFISTKVFVARPYDPIAQSFKLPTQYGNGAFITDIDVYFQNKPVAEQAPVMMEVRTCDSTGRPSATEILPGSEVIKYPNDVTIDATRGQAATKFTFKNPLYLLPEKNYAFVLKSDTKNYRVWIATLGQLDVNTPTSSYSTQATLGSLFKSQDGTLWTEDQLSDIKFRVNRAVFNTANAGARVHVVNHNIENAQLPSNPLTFVHGSNKIRVGQRNHGMSVGDVTRLYSAYWNAQYAANQAVTINGIPVSEIFGSYVSSNVTSFQPLPTDPRLTVSDVTMDTYTITTTTVANLGANAVTGVTNITGGGDDLVAQSNVLYHVAKPRATVLMSKPTTLTMQGKMLKGFTYDTDASAPAYPYTWTTLDLNINADTLLDSSSIILTDVNEYDRVDTSVNITAGGTGSIWTDSFIGILNLKTTTDHVSPAVDMSTFNLDLIQHRITNPGYSSRYPTPLPSIGSVSNLILMSNIATSNTTIWFDGSLETINTNTLGLFSNVTPGKYLMVSGSTVSANNYMTTGLLVLSVTPDGQTITVSGNLTSTAGGDAIYIWQLEDFIEETTDDAASGESKYITKQVDLQNPAAQLKMIVEVNCPSSADFDVFYRTGAAGTDLTDTIWQRFVAPLQSNPLSSYATIVKSENRNEFTDVEFNISNFDSTGTPRDLNPFTAFQVKIVMRSSNAARVPRFRNLRVIAHA